MRLILIDNMPDVRFNFYPLSLGRPLWELRCGMNSLLDKLIAKIKPDSVAYFVPDYMAEAYDQVKESVNDTAALVGDDLILVDPLVKAENFDVPAKGKSEIGLDENGRILFARINKGDIKKSSFYFYDSRNKIF